jgi:hypothetical protein
VAAGFQVKYSPPTGGKPLIFETLADLDGDAALNELRPLGWDRNPLRLSGATLVLAGRIDKLKTGEPLLLEDERDGRLQAHLIVGALVAAGSTTIHLSPPVSRHDGLLRGYHALSTCLPDRQAAGCSGRAPPAPRLGAACASPAASKVCGPAIWWPSADRKRSPCTVASRRYRANTWYSTSRLASSTWPTAR